MSDTISVENGTDIILAFLFAGGSRKTENEEIVGTTRLDKLIFLLAQETGLRKYLNDFSFEPYNFGPYSAGVFDAIQALENAGLVKVDTLDSEGYLDEADRYQIELQAGENVDSPKTTTVYSLTPEGMKVASALFNALSKQEQDELRALKIRFNSINLRKLLQYVYRKHPDYTTESKIRDYVF